MFYIAEMSMGYHGLTLIMDVKYQNTDVPVTDIHIVNNEAEITALFDRYIGNFYQKVILVCKNESIFHQAFNSFHETQGVRHPNLLNSSASMSKNSLTGSKCFATVQFEYRVERTVLHKHKLDVDIAIAKLCKTLFFASMPEELKVFLAHNYLTRTVKYVNEDHGRLTERSHLQSAYGALIKKECVCQGYAKAFDLIMKHEGITCYTVVGTSSNAPGATEDHAWNIVTLSGGKGSFQLDVTWDSNLGPSHYDFFCKDDSFMAASHGWNRANYPKCNSSYDVKAQAVAYINAHKPMLMVRKIPYAYFSL